MRKKMYFISGVTTALLAICLLLSACGIPEGKAQEEIVSDILAADNFFSEYSLKIDDTSIPERELDEEQKTEKMLLDIKASNDSFAYEASYDILYMVEDDSWVLGEWKKTGDSYLAIAPAAKEDVETALAGKYDTTVYVSDEGEGNEHSFKYTASKKGNDVTIDYDLTISLTFTPDEGWKAGTVKAEETGFSGICGESLTWAIDKSGVLAIKGSGAMTDFSKEKPAPWSNLPEQFAVKSVSFEDGLTHLGAYAFAQCNKLASISIPASTNNSGAAPFEGCGSLTEINYGGSRARWNAYLPSVITDDMQVTFKSAVSNAELVNSGTCGEKLAWTLDVDGVLTIAGEGEMDDYAIYMSDVKFNERQWGGYSIFDEDTPNIVSVIIEPGATSIGAGAFMMCHKLVDIELPASVTVIESSAFAECPNLKSIKLPSGLTEIGMMAFWGDKNLDSISFPESITRINDIAFYGCSSLKSVNLPSSLTELGYSAFQGCTGITEIRIPKGMEDAYASQVLSHVSPAFERSSQAFADCPNIKEIYYDGSEIEYRAKLGMHFGIDLDQNIHFGAEPAISLQRATEIARENCGFADGDVDPVTGFKQYLIGNIPDIRDGRAFYCYLARWEVIDDFNNSSHLSTIGFLYVDAETGECTIE